MIFNDSIFSARAESRQVNSWITIQTKLIMSFAITVLVVLVASIFAIYALAKNNENFSEYIHGINARALAAAGVRTAVDARAVAARNLVLVTSADDIAKEKLAVEAAFEDVRKNLSELSKSARRGDIPSEATKKIELIFDVEKRYAIVAAEIVNLALEGRKQEASAKIIKDCRPLLEELSLATKDYADFTAARSITLLANASEKYGRNKIILIIACVSAVLVAVFSGLSIVRSISGGLTQALLVANEVAHGNLRTEIKLIQQDEFGTLLNALHKMQQSLCTLVSNVTRGADAVATASSEIAQGNNDLSTRTENQASALQETAASMEQFGSTVKVTADSANHANQLAQVASGVASKGGKVVAEVVQTMREIQSSSEKIAEIISVIDGIAFQTNILALNAAIEAARAGDQGRGFAVVAGEVRSLAGRSAEAAKEIKMLISASTERVSDGAKLVDEAGKTMNEVVASIKRVSDIVAEISSSSREQSLGVAQVGDAVSAIDQVTQQNAALVEEMAAAASSLSNQAQDLVLAVSNFKTPSQSIALR